MLAEIFHRGTTEEPVAVVDLVYDKARFEDNDMWDHRIVERICVLGDVEILLDFTPRVRKERPLRTDSAAIFIRLSDTVGANRDQAAIADLKFSMELNKPFSLPAVLGAETTAAEDENHWMLSLQFGELPTFRGVIGKLIIGEDRAGNNVRSHIQPRFLLEHDHSQRQEPTKPRIGTTLFSLRKQNQPAHQTNRNDPERIKLAMNRKPKTSESVTDVLTTSCNL